MMRISRLLRQTWSRPARARTATRSTVVSAVLASMLAILAGAATVSAQSNNQTNSQASQGEGYHVVKEGETLYDLAAQYFGDRQKWPKLWSYNPQITNPHWIYPGDIVYLRPPEQVSGPKSAGTQKASTSSEETQQKDDSAFNLTGVDQTKKGLRLNTAGMIVKEQPTFVGRIVDSPKEARLIGEYDQVWVGFGDDAYAGKQRDRIPKRRQKNIRDPGKVERKTRFAIVQKAGPVENLEGDEVGTKYYVAGSLVVTETSEKRLETAYIDQSWREIERGDMLIPYERQLKRITHVPAQKNLVLRVIDTLHETSNFGDSHHVFLNKGASDGVRPGNRGYIYQKRSGLPNRWRDRPKIPWMRVGRVRVIDVRKHFSTAVVTDSKRELSTGDRVEMYEGN